MVSIRICTRPSRLAVIQAQMVSGALNEKGIDTEIIKVKSSGDKDLSSPLYKLGETGIFVEEVNKSVLSGEADIAVHSAKDLPSVMPEELEVLGVLPREEPQDVLVSTFSIDELPKGARIGTSSVRRIHQLKMIRPDLKIDNIRGNLDTRLRKLEKGEFDGIILAKAGIKRMQIKTTYSDLSINDFLPAPNQGIIAIVGSKDSPFRNSIEEISHHETYEEMILERRLITILELGCSLPAAVFCSKSGKIFNLRARFYSQVMREYKEFTRTFSEIEEVEKMAMEIIEKVPDSYGFNFKKR